MADEFDAFDDEQSHPDAEAVGEGEVDADEVQGAEAVGVSDDTVAVAEEVALILKRDPDFRPDDGDVSVSFPLANTVDGTDDHGRIVLSEDAEIEVPTAVARNAEGVAGVVVEQQVAD